jgi:hypothetical protein
MFRNIHGSKEGSESAISMKAGLPIAGYVTFNVKDVPFEVFKALLTFLYTGKIDLLRPRNTAENATPSEEEKATAIWDESLGKICENLDQRFDISCIVADDLFPLYPDRTLFFPKNGFSSWPEGRQTAVQSYPSDVSFVLDLFVTASR